MVVLIVVGMVSQGIGRLFWTGRSVKTGMIVPRLEVKMVSEQLFVVTTEEAAEPDILVMGHSVMADKLHLVFLKVVLVVLMIVVMVVFKMVDSAEADMAAGEALGVVVAGVVEVHLPTIILHPQVVAGPSTQGGGKSMCLASTRAMD